jgi:hypothetical protein
MRTFLWAMLICCILVLSFGMISCGCDDSDSDGDDGVGESGIDTENQGVQDITDESVDDDRDAGGEGSGSSYFDFVDKAKGL